MIGQTLSHYKILSEIAVDGTGTLYLATDTLVDRPVSLRTLADAVTADPERWQRVEQDALTASRLEHPNIARVHKFSRAEGVDFVVMEAPEGESALSMLEFERPHRRELLSFSAQILSALVAASERGVVHGPLNPAFIFISPTRQIKIHDFGFGLLGPPPQSEEGRRAFAGDSAPYFSPEQVAGAAAGPRSDIFSFGALLYHLAAGKPPFLEETVSGTWEAIVEAEAKPVSQVIRRAPPGIDRLIERCLRKNPERRFEQIGEIGPLLEQMAGDYSRNPLLNVSFVSRYRGQILKIAAVVLAATAVVTGAVFWWQHRPHRELILATQLRQITVGSGFDTDPAISPDGKLLAYASDRAGEDNLDIWVQTPEPGQPRRLTSDPADEREPAISPDGETVAFRSERDGGGIYLVAAKGGDARLIAPGGRRPRFSPDGRWIAYWVGPPEFGPRPEGAYKVFVIPAAGGQPRPIRANFASCTYPTWSADSFRLLFLGRQESASKEPEANDWWLTTLDDGQLHNTGACRLFHRQGLLAATHDAIPADWNQDQILFSTPSTDLSSIWRASLSPGNFSVSTSPVRVTSGKELDLNPSRAPGGRVFFSRQSYNADIWGIPVVVNEGKATGPPARWTHEPAAEVSPSLPADGSRIMFQSNRSGHYNLWSLDLNNGKSSSIMNSPEEQLWPIISPDGSKVAYTEMRIGRLEHFYKPLGGGPAQILCEDCGPTVSGWSPDSKAVLIDSFSRGVRRHLAVSLIELSSRRKTVLIEDPRYDLHQGRFSPDGRAIAFAARGDLGSSRLYLAPFRDARPSSPAELVALTDGHSWDAAPQWSADGKLVYFVSTRDGYRCIWAQRLDAANRPAGPAFAVTHLHSVRRSPTFLPFDNVDLFVGHDQLVLSLGDQKGNIWSAKLAD